MQLFNEYVHPAINWLHSNPEWALFITFVISFAESLAIVGSIIPGSITMTGIGILAGSGVIPIHSTLIAATLGAVVGDGISYLIGYFFSDRLTHSWPFKRYPHWLQYGKDFFSRHGGKSVLIGRFIGPLRSIIPVIAGMMHMSHWRFYIANVISAIFWSLLYVLPGVFLGAASNELPPESATKLIILVLGTLIGIWLLSFFTKWLLIKLNRFLNASLSQLWHSIRASKHQHLKQFINLITPKHEINHYATAGVFILLVLLTLLLLMLIGFVTQHPATSHLNNPLHLAIQSLRSQHIDLFFIQITQAASPLPLCLSTLFLLGVMLYQRDGQLLKYSFSLFISTSVALVLAHTFIYCPHPIGILDVQQSNAFPATPLTYIAVLLFSVLLYLNKTPHLKFRSYFNIGFGVLLLLIGFGEMELGDYELTDILGAYLLSSVLCLSHWLFYRKAYQAYSATKLTISLFTAILIVSTLASAKLHHEQQYKKHQPVIAQYIFTNDAWWKQKKPLLPVYRRNRFGHPISLFNIQYVGSLEHFSAALMTVGWSKQQESFYKSLIKRLNGYSANQEFPLMAQLYLNRKPNLVMSYPLQKNGPVLILRLWQSNYYIQDDQQRIWIGSIHTRAPLKGHDLRIPNAMNPLFFIEQALPPQFLQRKIRLNISGHTPLILRVVPLLLLIHETPTQLADLAPKLIEANHTHNNWILGKALID